MIAKKTNKADLEGKRFAFFQIGMLVAGAVTLVAFEYSTVHEESKKTVVEDYYGETMVACPVMPDEIPDKPEPRQTDQQQQAPIQLMPVDTLVIAQGPINPNTTITTQIIPIIDPDPCLDCGTTPVPIIVEPPVDVPDKEPEFKGGLQAMYKFISENVVYPDISHQMGDQGIVHVQFIVNKDGSISDVKTESKVSKELKAEAIRVVSLMPAWIPGEQAGKPVRVRFTVPINFTIKNQ